MQKTTYQIAIDQRSNLAIMSQTGSLLSVTFSKNGKNSPNFPHMKPCSPVLSL